MVVTIVVIVSVAWAIPPVLISAVTLVIIIATSAEISLLVVPHVGSKLKPKPRNFKSQSLNPKSSTP